MIIACVKCSTQYVLEDGILPLGGASVQCTRCGHVFSAKPAEALPKVTQSRPAGEPKVASARKPMPEAFGVPPPPRPGEFLGAAMDDSKTVLMSMPVMGAPLSPSMPPEAPSSSGALPDLDSAEASTSIAPLAERESRESPPPVEKERARPDLPQMPEPALSMPPLRAGTQSLPKAEKRRSPNWFVALSVLVLVAFVAVALVDRLVRMRRAPAAAAVIARESALIRLLRDDEGSRAEALAALDALCAQHPQYVEAHALKIIALSWAADDARLRVRRADATLELLNRDLRELETFQSPADWESRTEGLRKAVDSVTSGKVGAQKSVQEWEGRAAAGLAALSALTEVTSEEELRARARAVAMYWAVKGDPKALDFIEAYKKLPLPENDAWLGVLMGEYVNNVRAPKEELAGARAAMQGLRQRETTHFRAYVLEARGAMAMRDFEGARSVLEQVLMLNSNHQTAQLLIEWLGDIEKGTSNGMTSSGGP